jgi:prolyl-tRNA editing enzyme YbaK/EbsC (Cys-tRNA(Pro) deacylase)/ubiquinone/menaquinone biosynthesis C-methylase UbiE
VRNIGWEEGKAAHLELSETAADSYDSEYGDENFATRSYMDYERVLLAEFIKESPSRELAVDLGCGTGRDTFELARHFEQVHGFDFSPAMIRVAERTKLRRRVGNALFDVQDVEEGLWQLPDECASFVNTGFGMGSFVKNLEPLFREVRRILKPQGIAVFSFYNREAIVNRLSLEWKPALAARLEEDGLSVDFGGKVRTIAALPYTVDEVRHHITGNFRALSLRTYPTLSALFPNSMFADEVARELCTHVDRVLSENHEVGGGPYILAVGQKGGALPRERPKLGYARVLELLERVDSRSITKKEHAPVHNMPDVVEIAGINAEPSQMIKSVLLAWDDPDRKQQDDRSAQLFLFGIPADTKLDLGKVSRLLGRPRNQLRFATQVQVETLTGFSVGSIPPFAMPKAIAVVLDERLLGFDRVWCGTGKATESIALQTDVLRRLSACSTADVAK